MNQSLQDIVVDRAPHQPSWPDPVQATQVRHRLARRPALVDENDVRHLRGLLAHVAAGSAHVVQTGDCAEDPDETTIEAVARKTALLDVLAGTLKRGTHKPVLRVGRIAGQFAKPRSEPTEIVGGAPIPTFQGHMVNSPEPDPCGRVPDPERMLLCYEAARDVMGNLGWPRGDTTAIDPPVWTSHEALLLDYELPLVRRTPAGELLLASTHWPWIGERTRQPDGAHVALLAQVLNPVACKVGPTTSVEDLLALCQQLDPRHEPGRLTFISRMGARLVEERLPPLVEAVRDAGHPVIWLCDPMHGNTIKTLDGVKTRLVDTITAEVRAARRAITEAGGIAGGLHLETAIDDVTECATHLYDLPRVADKYTSFCDPRLNPEQAAAVVAAWTD